MVDKVLIVDNVSTRRIVLRAKFASAFIDTAQAGTAQEALQRLKRPGINLLLIASNLVDMSAVELCKAVRENFSQYHLPIMIIGATRDLPARLTALTVGADEVLSSLPSDQLLLARIRCLLRTREGLDDAHLREECNRVLGLREPKPNFIGRGRIAHIGSTEGADWVKGVLRTSPNAFLIANQTSQNIMRAASLGRPPDICIVDVPPHCSDRQLELLSTLRSQQNTGNMALLAIIRNADPTLLAIALDRGADDVVCLPDTSEAEMVLRLNRLLSFKRHADQLRSNLHGSLHAAITDPLTGLYNRRFALPRLNQLTQRSEAKKQMVAVMVADLDHFKHVNDHHGHAVGDAVLQAVAQRFRQALPDAALIARIGGEEFLVVVEIPSPPAAAKLAQKLCSAVSDTPIRIMNVAHPLNITTSVGYAMATGAETGISPEDLIEQADHALFAAKGQGRNRVHHGKTAA